MVIVIYMEHIIWIALWDLQEHYYGIIFTSVYGFNSQLVFYMLLSTVHVHCDVTLHCFFFPHMSDGILFTFRLSSLLC